MSKQDELVELVKYVKKHNNLYNCLYKNIDENNFELEQLPFFKRTYIRNNLKNAISDSFSIDSLVRESTYGTTEGVPLKIYKSSLERVNLGLLLWNHRQSINNNASKRCAHYYYNTDNINATPLIKVNANKVNIDLPAIKKCDYDYVNDLMLLINYDIKWLICPPTLAYKISQIALEYNIFPNLEIIEFLSEYIPKYYKEAIENVFKCNTCVEYGCHEIWGIAFSNKNNHLEIMENIILEQIDDDRFINGYGQCKVTNLKLKSLPFIRYELNDLIYLKDGELKTYGFRASDSVKMFDVNIHCSFFSNLFEYELKYKIYPLEDYQIVYDDKTICLLLFKYYELYYEDIGEFLKQKIKIIYKVDIDIEVKKTTIFYTDSITGKMKGIIRCNDLKSILNSRQ